MTIIIAITLNARQEAGVNAATAEFNALQPSPITPTEYITERLLGLADDYYTNYQAGAIPVSAFILRFTGAEIDAIKALAATDVLVAAFFPQLDDAPEGKVWLLSDTVQGGLQYLAAKGVLTPARAAAIGAI